MAEDKSRRQHEAELQGQKQQLEAAQKQLAAKAPDAAQLQQQLTETKAQLEAAKKELAAKRKATKQLRLEVPFCVGPEMARSGS